MSLIRHKFRSPHLGKYPMETVRKIDRPTTAIQDEKVPRVPMRGSFFNRAKHGDLGSRTQHEFDRFDTKSPLSAALDDVMSHLVSQQDGEVAGEQAPGTDNALKMTEHIKSLCYFLDADIVGVCEIPDYAWYSHDSSGQPIQTDHKYAIVLMMDQGYEAMEGSSGDDWISAPQSYRAYLKGQTAANVTANYIRRLGFNARCHSSKDGEVQQIPLTLLAGLGELCRMGEVVMNPFLGPRSTTTVITTDLPLVPDQPIDFGMQQFCDRCYKCARECPCRAISFGDKINFNGYEIWKPDIELCTKYRITNQRGSACGRCMKTCPLNKILRKDGPLLVRLAHWLSLHVKPLRKPLTPLAVWLDDVLKMGNPVRQQKWWLDFEYKKGKVVGQRQTNDWSIKAFKSKPAKQRIPIYVAEDLPPGDFRGPYPVDRRSAHEKGLKASKG